MKTPKFTLERVLKLSAELNKFNVYAHDTYFEIWKESAQHYGETQRLVMRVHDHLNPETAVLFDKVSKPVIEKIGIWSPDNY